MVGDILRVKTSIPPPAARIVLKEKLQDHLGQGLISGGCFSRPLTLFSAPAGFGKTTMARAWLNGKEKQTAWYSLDEADNDPERFWIYLVTALQAADSTIGTASLDILRSSSLFGETRKGAEAFLTPLLNDLLSLGKPLFLTLDDYHLVDDSRIHEDMIFLIENLPPTLHLVLTTRSDPPWPLARWRARGWMVEARLRELKFSEEETAALFNQLPGPSLTADQLGAIHRKAEGWAAGLRLAAASLVESDDPEQFIRNFTGTNRHLLQFLSEEVLSGQDRSTIDFLLQTSILDRFCAPLCDHLTGRDDSAEILELLQKKNLFIISLDQDGFWFRYHSLFAELLRFKLKEQQADMVKTLPERAWRWFLDNGEYVEAVRHALAAGSIDAAAMILNDHHDRIIAENGPGLLNQHLEAISEDSIQVYPRLALYKALHHLIHRGRSESIDALVVAGEEQHRNEAERADYEGTLKTIKAYIAIYGGQYEQARELAASAASLLPSSNCYWRMNAAIYSGDAYLFNGNPREAHPYYLEAQHTARQMENRFFTLTAGFKVSTALYYLGRLELAESQVRCLLNRANEQGFSRVARVGLLWTLLGEMLREKGRLEEAGICIERGLLFSMPEKPSYAWNSLYKTALEYSLGLNREALVTLSGIRALDREYGLPFFITTPAAAWEAKVLNEQGDPDAAREALERCAVTAGGKPEGGNQRGYLLFCRLLGKEKGGLPASLEDLPGRIKMAAERNGDTRLLIEALFTETFLMEWSGNPVKAEAALALALEAAERCGYFQLVLDESRAASPIIARLVARGEVIPPAFAGALQACLPGTVKPVAGRASAAGSPAEEGLIEALSARELEIVTLISEGLSNEEIGGRLYISTGTVKWHTTNIFGKLGVNNRTGAAARARDLHLLPE